MEVQFGRYQKNILQEWSMVKNLSCVSCAAWNVFPINSLVWVSKGSNEATITLLIRLYKVHYQQLYFVFNLFFSQITTLQFLTGKYRQDRGVQGNRCNENRDPIMRTEIPCNQNRFFSVRIDLQGVPCKPYRVWVYSVYTGYDYKREKENYLEQHSSARI